MLLATLNLSHWLPYILWGVCIVYRRYGKSVSLALIARSNKLLVAEEAQLAFPENTIHAGYCYQCQPGVPDWIFRNSAAWKSSDRRFRTIWNSPIDKFGGFITVKCAVRYLLCFMQHTNVSTRQIKGHEAGLARDKINVEHKNFQRTWISWLRIKTTFTYTTFLYSYTPIARIIKTERKGEDRSPGRDFLFLKFVPVRASIQFPGRKLALSVCVIMLENMSAADQPGSSNQL